MAYTEKDFNLSWGDITIGQANTLVVTRPSAQYSFRFHYDFQGVSADVTADAYIEDIKYCPFCGEEL